VPVIDRLPPQSLEAEQSVLGAILIDRDAVVEIAEFLRPADFYRQANGKIFEAVLDLFERREPIDIVTVSEALERSGDLETVGGRAYLSSLSSSTPTAVHAAQYGRIVERKAVLRNLIGAAWMTTQPTCRTPETPLGWPSNGCCCSAHCCDGCNRWTTSKAWRRRFTIRRRP
jgi:replicative DNA helicase